MVWGLCYTDYTDMVNFQIAKVFRNGKSLVVALPVNFSRGLNIERGDHVVFSLASADVILMRKLADSDMKNYKPEIIQYT